MIRLELLDNCDEQVWDDLVATFEEGTIFHTWAWMRVIEKLKHAEKLPFGIFDGPDMVGVFPLFRVRRGPLTILASPLGSVGYGGPLVDRSHHWVVMEQLDSLLKRFRADYVEFRSTEKLAPTALINRNYTVQELPTYVLSLDRDPQELWSNLMKRCRGSIRKARKNNVEILEATDKSFLNVYYEMTKDTYSKSNRPPPLSVQGHITVLDLLRPYDRVKVLLARHDDQVIAGIIVLCFCGKLYGWDAVAFQSHFKLCPNNLLHWTVIEWGARNGLKQYDMMGSNIPRIARFLESFGGELRTYTYAYKDATWRAFIGRRLYRWLVPKIHRVRARPWSA